MKLPKTWPGWQNVDGELLVGILMGPSAHGPGHADLAFPVALEPLWKQQASQATRSHSATATENIKKRPRSILCTHLALSLSHSSLSSFFFLSLPLFFSFSHILTHRILRVQRYGKGLKRFNNVIMYIFWFILSLFRQNLTNFVNDFNYCQVYFHQPMFLFLLINNSWYHFIQHKCCD